MMPSKNPIYKLWDEMRRRCASPAADAYDRYGGRGITVCQRWQDSFVAFAEDMGPRPFGTSIDRIDNNGNYEPGNCRWATRKQQAQNTRRNISVEVNGEFLCLREACDKTGANYHLTRRRVLAGETFQAAVSRPPDYRPNSRKTHCRNGHAFDESNTYLHSGRRHCRACRAALAACAAP